MGPDTLLAIAAVLGSQWLMHLAGLTETQLGPTLHVLFLPRMSPPCTWSTWFLQFGHSLRHSYHFIHFTSQIFQTDDLFPRIFHIFGHRLQLCPADRLQLRLRGPRHLPRLGRPPGAAAQPAGRQRPRGRGRGTRRGTRRGGVWTLGGLGEDARVAAHGAEVRDEGQQREAPLGEGAHDVRRGEGREEMRSVEGDVGQQQKVKT